MRLPGTAGRASARFAAALGRPDVAGRGAWLGIENEYQLWSSSVQCDFRDMVGYLGLGRDHLDPRDRFAYRLRSGAILTADEREAEIALPPQAVTPGFVDALDAAVAAEERDLQARLPKFSVRGHSTHISVSVEGQELRVARLYARTFAPAAVLMLAQRDSAGVIVRPRPGRVELVTEYLDSSQRRAATCFAVATVNAVAAALSSRASRALDGLEVETDVAVSQQRPGWFISRHVRKGDLCVEGRSTILRRPNGETLTAQEHLERAWAMAREASATVMSAQDFAAPDAVVLRLARLPSERSGVVALAMDALAQVPTGDAPADVRRPGFDVAPVMLSWHVQVHVAVELASGRRAFICVPRAWIDRFQAYLEDGSLDAALTEYLALSRSGRRLTHPRQAVRPGLFDELGPRHKLLLEEPSWRRVAAA